VSRRCCGGDLRPPRYGSPTKRPAPMDDIGAGPCGGKGGGGRGVPWRLRGGSRRPAPTDWMARAPLYFFSPFPVFVALVMVDFQGWHTPRLFVALRAFFYVFVASKASANGAHRRCVVRRGLAANSLPSNDSSPDSFPRHLPLVNLSGATRALRRRRRRHRPSSPLVPTMKEHRQHEAAYMAAANW